MIWIDNTFKVALFGHRRFNEHWVLDKHLLPLLRDLIRTKPFVEFYIGRNGEFDIYASTVIKRIQAMTGKENSSLICVLPYPEKDIEYYEKYYDSVIIPECAENAHPKVAITKRNRWMVEQSDLVVCYIERESGGAYTALKHAKGLQKQIINLANINRDE